MGIANNNFRDGYGTLRFFGATTSNGSYPYIETYGNKTGGSNRNIFAGEAGINAKSSKPAGARHPVAWQMPQKAGGLASHNNTRITLSESGSAALGLPASGSAEITFTQTATGGLIVSGSGSASITFSPTGTLISVAAGSGSATVTLSGSALIGALAGISGQSSITFTPTAVIRAVGYLAGLSTNETEFSADALARAVWDAVAADFNISGTMGEKLNAAGTAGDPWTADLSPYLTGTAGDQLRKALTTGKFLALK